MQARNKSNIQFKLLKLLIITQTSAAFFSYFLDIDSGWICNNFILFISVFMKGMHLWNPQRYKSTLALPLLSPKDLLSSNSPGFNKATQLLLTTFTHANQITCLFTSTSSPHIQCFRNLHSAGMYAEQRCISEPKTLMTSQQREILTLSRTFNVKEVCGSCRLRIPKLKKNKIKKIKLDPAVSLQGFY